MLQICSSCVAFFVGVSTCTLNVQTNSLPDVVTGSSSLLPFRTVLCCLCAQPALFPPPGLFQPVIRWHKRHKKSGFWAWTTYSGGVLKRVFAPSVTSPSAAGHCSCSISLQFLSSTHNLQGRSRDSSSDGKGIAVGSNPPSRNAQSSSLKALKNILPKAQRRKMALSFLRQPSIYYTAQESLKQLS